MSADKEDANDDCWDAFGSDSDSDDDDGDGNENSNQQEALHPNTCNSTAAFESAADAIALAITQHFISLMKSTGVSLKERVVAIGSSCVSTSTSINDSNAGNEMSMTTMMAERIAGRGMKVAVDFSEGFMCDAAVIIEDPCILEATDGEAPPSSSSSLIRQGLLPGGVLWLVAMSHLDTNDNDGHGHSKLANKHIAHYSEAIWDTESATSTLSTPHVQVIRIQKRSCMINAWTCPWMDKDAIVGTPSNINEQSSFLGNKHDFPLSEKETYLQYERRVAGALTVSPSVAERNRENSIDSHSKRSIPATVLTDGNVKNATSILQNHGFVIIKGLLPPHQTIPWGDAVLSDFETAVDRLKCHPVRPVDLINPQYNASSSASNEEERVFEPLSYKEMAMREDLRVDLRAGPEMEKLRCMENDLAFQSMAAGGGEIISQDNSNNLNNGPSTVTAAMSGTVCSWRFHPSIVGVLKTLFNPRDDGLYRGNFGRWNFGGAGPDGSPQPFRMGQIGSVISCPGAGDQAIHADTPHLFEHVDCLPCHYANVFTPGYKISNDPITTAMIVKNEFDKDGIWTGNSSMGGTALVQGSHQLSVSAMLLSEDELNHNNHNSVLSQREMLQLRTIRPALDAGDVVIFDNRTLHYGLANTSERDTGVKGGKSNVGRRPMLYLNVTQSWFHDPKNWDDRESIFS